MRIDPSTPPGWTPMWWLSAAQLVSWGSLYYSFSLFITPMMSELGWSKSGVTGAFSLGLLMAALLAIPVGRLIDRGRARLIMTGGSLLAAVLLLAWSRVEDWPLFYVVWGLMGASLATVLYEPAFAVLTAAYGSRYRKAITLMTLVGGLASTAFIPLTQWLIVELGWRHALWVLALCNLGFCALVHVLVLPARLAVADRSRATPVTQDALRAATARPVFWLLLVCFATNAFIFSGVSAHLVPLLQEKGMAMAVLVLAAALIGPSQVGARLLTLGGHDRLDARRLGRLTTALLPLALVLLYFVGPSGALVWVFAVSYGMSNGMMTIVRGIAVPEFLGPQGYGAVTGALAFPSTLAKAAAPVSMSLVWGWWGGYEAVIGLLFLCALLSALAFWRASSRSGRQVVAVPASTGA